MADRVRVGCLAQLVNVIAPLVTNETGVLRQSIYYPYAWALRYAKGRVLDLRVESETYAITAAGLQPDFARDEPYYRSGFEAAHLPALRGKSYEQALDFLTQRYQISAINPAFRRGYERGQQYHQTL